jgi:alpha-L-fucosidase 2
MKPRCTLRGLALALALTGPVTGGAANATNAPEHRVRFDAPAKHLTESCPLGNGRLGAMLFGGLLEERLILNEAGMWSGSVQEADRPDAATALPEIRRLLREGRNVEAERMVFAHFTCAGRGSGFGNGANVPYGTYQVLGNLRLVFDPPAVAAGGPPPRVTEYDRELDLATAIARVRFERGGVRYEREAFVSAPDEVVVLRLTASRPGSVSFALKLDRPERAVTTADGPRGLLLAGRLSDGQGGGNVGFAAAVRVVAKGGRVAVDATGLRVSGADEVVLLVGGETDIKSFNRRRLDDAVAAARVAAEQAAGRPYAALRQAHVAWYRERFDRVALRLDGTPAAVAGEVTQDRLVAQALGRRDPGLAQLYFDFGRYALISSTRGDGFPPNLQGLWADGVTTPWNGDWHLNINVQMNLWPAEVCNLPELHDSLFGLIASLREPGRRTAQKYYAARGWVAHVITNPWGFTSPGEGADWGATTTGSAWLCQHLWDHYLFTGDREFLRHAYPLLKGSAEFYADMLIEEPTHHWLVTAPSNSPENAYFTPEGAQAHICLGPTIDSQIVRYLFGATVEAAKVLGLDPELQAELTGKMGRLAPTRIGSDGRVMEWLQEYREVDPHHRHVSHLWGLYPGGEITRAGTPALAEAARKTLNARGDGGTGWALAHKLALWARLGDGRRGEELLRALLKPAVGDERITTTGGGTYPNLFDGHPPFQIDGNFGGAAAIAELLVQSRLMDVSGPARAEIELLPALPPGWSSGEVRGLRARGGFEVSVRWQDGGLTAATIRSLHGTPVTVRCGEHARSLTLAAGASAELGRDLQ